MEKNSHSALTSRVHTYPAFAHRLPPLILALVLTLTLGSASSAHATGSRTLISIDCLVGETNNDDHALVPGDILTVTVVNCQGWTIEDLDHASTGNTDISGGSFVVSTNGLHVFLVMGSADIDFDPPVDGNGDTIGSVGDIDLDVYLAYQATIPPGSLVDTRTFTMTRDEQDFEIGAVADYGDYYDLGGNPDCELELGSHTYVTQSFAATTSGDYTFRNISVSPADEDVVWGAPQYPNQDIFLALYTSFDPDDPEANLVACNDDRPEEFENAWYRYASNGLTTYVFDWQAPEMTVALPSGTYDLVVTTWASIEDTEWFNGEYPLWGYYEGETWDWDSGGTRIDMTALMEIWRDERPVSWAGTSSVGPENPGTPGIYLWVPPGNNRIASGSPVYVGSDRVASGSTYEVEIAPLNVWEKPAIVASGVVGSSGSFTTMIALPGLKLGVHQLVFRVTSPTRAELTLTNHLTIGAGGRIQSVSPEAEQPRL